MTIEAANSILKILEEPPERTIFILVAEETGSIPSTIISRCRQISFLPLADGVMSDIMLSLGVKIVFPLSLAQG
jgi:DNA polymerase-3 subunit delta'